MKLILRTLAAATVLAALSMPVAARDYYGAIAFAPGTNANGYSYDYPSRRAAERAALNECYKRAGGCRIATWFRNACGALALGYNGAWGAHWAGDRYGAEASAISICSRHGGGCAVIRWACTTR